MSCVFNVATFNLAAPIRTHLHIYILLYKGILCTDRVLWINTARCYLECTCTGAINAHLFNINNFFSINLTLLSSEKHSINSLADISSGSRDIN